MPNTTRRSYIAALLAGSVISLSGCADTTEEKTTEEYNVQITSTAENVEYSAEMTQPLSGQKSEPLAMEITLQNTSDKQILYGDQRDAFFSYETSSDAYGLYAESSIPRSSYAYNSEKQQWELTESLVRTTDFQTATLNPQEYITQSVILLHLQTEKEQNSIPSSLQFTNQLQITVESEQEWITNILTLAQ